MPLPWLCNICNMRVARYGFYRATVCKKHAERKMINFKTNKPLKIKVKTRQMTTTRPVLWQKYNDPIILFR